MCFPFVQDVNGLNQIQMHNLSARGGEVADFQRPLDYGQVLEQKLRRPITVPINWLIRVYQSDRSLHADRALFNFCQNKIYYQQPPPICLFFHHPISAVTHEKANTQMTNIKLHHILRHALQTGGSYSFKGQRLHHSWLLKSPAIKIKDFQQTD